ADCTPEAGLIATGQAYEVALWDCASGKKLRTPGGTQYGYNPTLTRFIDHGSRLVTCGAGSLDVWDTPTGARLQQIPCPVDRHFKHAAVSPEGKRLAAVAAFDKTRGGPARITDTVLVWDLTNGEPLRLQGNDIGEVSCVEFGPGEDRLLVGDEGGHV